MKTKVIMGIFIVLFLVSSLIIMPAFTLPSGAVSHWTFDEGSGTIAYDSIGMNDGTLINGPVWTTGIVDGALSFDGVDDYVSVADSAGLRPAIITVECWAKIDAVPDNGAHVVDKILWGVEGYALMVQPWGVAQFAVVTNIDTFAVDGTANIVGDGNFHHIAGTYDGVKARIYVNGVLEGSTDASGSIVYSGSYDLTIGDNNPISVRRRVEGLVDEVAIYNRALTLEEIQQRYLSGLPVVARLERHHVYEASIFEDSVSNVLLNGVPKQSYYIRPLEGAIVTGAQMEMVTLHPDETFPSIEWDPVDDFTVEGPVGGSYTYLWEFSSISEQAAVWIQTNFPEEFQLPFACHRTWNPWITLDTVTQTLTLVFEPSEVGGVHIHVRPESTDEASVAILSASSPTWPGSFWFDVENGKLVGANWGGDCGIGTYIFYIEIEVENEAFPDPIYYKPSVGLSLSLDATPNQLEITEDHVTIWDDVDGDGVVPVDERFTYSGTGDNNWQVIMKDDYDVVLPSYSREVPFMAEGKAFIRLGEGFIKGSAFLVSGPTPPIPKYVYLNADGQGFWWETTEISVKGNMISLKCEPTTATTGNPGPAPIVLKISKPEVGKRVTASGPGVCFTGQITKIETPS